MPKTAEHIIKRKCGLEKFEPSKARKLSKEAELIQGEPEDDSNVDHSRKATKSISHDAPDAKRRKQIASLQVFEIGDDSDAESLNDASVPAPDLNEMETPETGASELPKCETSECAFELNHPK